MDKTNEYHGPACGCDACLGRTTEWIDNGDGTFSIHDVVPIKKSKEEEK